MLRGRLAVITGAASGIGRTVCQVFASESAYVVAVDTSEMIHESVKFLQEGSRHKAYVADVSKHESVENLFKNIKQDFAQTPCCIVNCAGITRDKLLLKMTEKDFDDVLAVNLKGTFLVTQQASKHMVHDKIKNGSIVNISSIVAKVGNMGQCNYSASKAGVMGLTKSAAKELARSGIRCNAILPGFIDTPMIENVPQKVLDSLISSIPMGRVGKPSEIADACLYLASDRSSYVTGICLEVAGGLMM